MENNQTTLFEEKEERKKIKLKDEKGFFILDNVKINYDFKVEEYGRPHIDFRSAEEKKPNLISETGYRSWFIEWDLTESVITSVRQLIEMFCENSFSDKHYELKFEEQDEPEEEEIKIKSDEINKLIKRCKGKEEYSYLFVEYMSNPTLDSKNEFLSMSSTHEKPKEQEGSSWGTDSWEYDKDDEDGTLEKLEEELLDFVKDKADKPFHLTIEGIGTTTIKRENIIVSFSKKAKEYLTGLGFDFKKYEKELKEIKQDKATKEDIRKSTTFDLMEKQVDKLKDECWAIKGYFDECCFLPLRYKKEHYYSDKLKKLKIDTIDLNKLRDLYIKKANTYKVLYKKVHLQRFGEQPEEDNCYP